MSNADWLLFAVAIVWCIGGIAFACIPRTPMSDVRKLAPKGTFPEKPTKQSDKKS